MFFREPPIATRVICGIVGGSDRASGSMKAPCSALSLESRWWLSSVWLVLLLIQLTFRVQGQTLATRTQEIPLNTGWNLVSLQVAPVAGYSPAALVSQVYSLTSEQPVNALQAIWQFENVSQQWTSYQATNSSYAHDLINVVPGRGYWMWVNQPCLLRLTDLPWEGSVVIRPGWNLVGLPGLQADASGVALEAIFRDKLAFIQQVWGYDSTPARRRYLGYDTSARPALKELSTIEPGKAYWIYSTITELLDVTAVPAISLPPDLDNPPLSATTPRAPGAEDAGNDLNGNGILDDSFTQDTLLFPEGINTRLVTILNLGVGRLNWFATVLAAGSGSFVTFATATPSVAASSLAPDLVSAQVGRTTLSGVRSASGSVASEPSHLTIQVDRAGLLPGRFTNTFTIVAGNLSKVIKVVVVVPSIDGDWRGFAATRKVNGKDIAIGKVDLQLAIFRQGTSTNASEANLRAVINSDRSLLFPRDVAMSGAFVADHEFFLTTNFEVPRGDRNAPPFDKFQSGQDDRSAGKGFGDFDANNDGRLDNSNPFPFALRREISLLGVRRTDSRLTGNYIESIQNILPGAQKIYIEGEFELERMTLAPTLTSVFNSTLSTNAIIGGGGSSSFTTTFNVTNSFAVEGVSGQLNLDFGGGKDVEVRLTAPGGTNSVVILPKTQGLTGNQSYSLNQFNGIVGTGPWRLTVTWAGGSERGNFYGWDLQLKGTATYNVSGTVATLSGGVATSLSGVLVSLTGHGAVAQTTTGADGKFLFTNLTENDFTLMFSKPGYTEVRQDFDLFSASKDLGTNFLTKLTTDASSLAVAPSMGGQPLNVSFTPLLSTADATSIGAITSLVWDFGNGVTLNMSTNVLAPVSHVYTNAGYYAPVLTVVGTASQRKYTNFVHSLRQRATNTPYNLLSIGLIGSMAAGGEVVTGAATNVQVTVGGVASTRSMLTAVNLRESIRDVAAFDINRNGTAFDPIREVDTDVFQSSQNGPGTNGVFYLVNDGGGGDNTYTSNTNALRYRMICTIGGAVFGPGPSRVGYQSSTDPAVFTNYVLSVGRIEP